MLATDYALNARNAEGAGRLLQPTRLCWLTSGLLDCTKEICESVVYRTVEAARDRCDIFLKGRSIKLRAKTTTDVLMAGIFCACVATLISTLWVVLVWVVPAQQSMT